MKRDQQDLQFYGVSVRQSFGEKTIHEYVVYLMDQHYQIREYILVELTAKQILKTFVPQC